MSPDIPAVPPEADVIRLAREAADMTAQSAAEASRAHDGKGVSAAYWRDVERGSGGRRGQRVPTRASARALAAMARVVGVTPPQLAAAGREDAGRVLAEILRRESPALLVQPPLDTGPDTFPAVSPELQRDMARHEAEILIRLEIAERGHPGEKLTGAMIFPTDERSARSWDALTSTFVGWEPKSVAKGLAVMRADAEAQTEHNRRTGLPAAPHISPLASCQAPKAGATKTALSTSLRDRTVDAGEHHRDATMAV